MIKHLIHVVLFLAVMLSTAAGLRHIDPLPFWSWTRNKLGYIAEHLDEFDVVCVGSSRIHRSFVPEEFDRRCAELGKTVHSFNLGFAGSRPHDFTVMIDWLIQHRTEKLKCLIIELDSFHKADSPSSWLTNEGIEMHTIDQAWPRIRSAIGESRTLGELASSVYHILAMTTVNYLRVGQATRILTDYVAQWRSGNILLRGNLGVTRGFEALALETAPEHRKLQHLEWHASDSERAQRLRQKQTNVDCVASEDGLDMAALEQQVSRLHEAGIQTIYLLPPRYSWLKGRPSITELAERARVIALDDPRKSADLYEPDLWFDGDHLMRNGAMLFSRRLAEQFVQ